MTRSGSHGMYLEAGSHWELYAPQEGRSDIGRGSMIVRDPETALLLGGSDPRGDGFALGY
jgi:gamma-glutamyltranspeptidase